MSDECAFCAANELPAAELPARERVLAGGDWRVMVNRSGLPGWLLVICGRHILSLAELTPSEQQSLGPVLAAGTKALAEVVGSEKTYAMLFAEGTKHVHFSLVPRMPDIPDHLKGAAVSGYNTEAPPPSDDERDRLAEQLTAAWPSPRT